MTTMPGCTAIARTKTRATKPAAHVGPLVETTVKAVPISGRRHELKKSKKGSWTEKVSPSRFQRRQTQAISKGTAVKESEKQYAAKAAYKETKIKKRKEEKVDRKHAKQHDKSISSANAKRREETKVYAYKPASPFGPETKYTHGKHTDLGIEGIKKASDTKQAVTKTAGEQMTKTAREQMTKTAGEQITTESTQTVVDQAEYVNKLEKALVDTLQEEIQLTKEESERVRQESVALISKYRHQLEQAIGEVEDLKTQVTEQRSSITPATFRSGKVVVLPGKDIDVENYTHQLEQQLKKSMEEVMELKMQKIEQSESAMLRTKTEDDILKASQTLGFDAMGIRRTPSRMGLKESSRFYDFQSESGISQASASQVAFAADIRSEYTRQLEEEVQELLEEVEELKTEKSELTKSLMAAEVPSSFPSKPGLQTARSYRRASDFTPETKYVHEKYMSSAYIVPQQSTDLGTDGSLQFLKLREEQRAGMSEEASHYTKILENELKESLEEEMEFKIQEIEQKSKTAPTIVIDHVPPPIEECTFQRQLDLHDGSARFHTRQSSEFFRNRQIQDAKAAKELFKYRTLLEGQRSSIDDIMAMQAEEPERVISRISQTSAARDIELKRRPTAHASFKPASQFGPESRYISQMYKSVGYTTPRVKPNVDQQLQQAKYTRKLEDNLKESLQEEIDLKIQKAERIAEEERTKEMTKSERTKMTQSERTKEMTKSEIIPEQKLSADLVDVAGQIESEDGAEQTKRRAATNATLRESKRALKKKKAQKSVRISKESSQKAQHQVEKQKRQSQKSTVHCGMRSRQYTSRENAARKEKKIDLKTEKHVKASRKEQESRRKDQESRHEDTERQKAKQLLQRQTSSTIKKSGHTSISKAKSPKVPSRVAQLISKFDKSCDKRITSGMHPAKSTRAVARGVKPATHFGPEVKKGLH